MDTQPEQNQYTEIEYYKAKEIAQKLRLDIITIYRYIKTGKIVAQKIGKEFRVKKEEFENFLQRARIK